MTTGSLVARLYISGARIAQSVYRLRYGLDGPEFESRRGRSECFLFKMSRRALVPIQPQLKVPGSFVGVKRPDRWGDHLPPSSVEVKKGWSCACTHYMS